MKGKCVHKKNVDEKKREKDGERAGEKWVSGGGKKKYLFEWQEGKDKTEESQRKVEWVSERERRTIGKLRNIKNEN